MRSTLNERVAGFVLVTFFLLPLAILGYLILRGRAGARALDHFVNAAVFNGYAWESVSSHAWREQHRWWARLVIAFTDRIDAQHCRRANKREQPVVDLVLHKRLHEQTIL